MNCSVFVYESMTGGGTLSWPRSKSPPESLLAEGTAMVEAVVNDFGRIAGTLVSRTVDARLSVRGRPAGPRSTGPADRTIVVATPLEHDRAVAHLAKKADVTFVIAPELDGELMRVARLVTAAGGTLLGPSLDTISWASEKQATADRLARAGIPCAGGLLLRSGANPDTQELGMTYPLVAKRNDGAGSCDMRLIANRDTLRSFLPSKRDIRLEPFYEGTNMSVALIGGPGRPLCLQPCLQAINANRRFEYVGGEVHNGPLATRATRLAEQVAGVLVDETGYIGVDMILGHAETGTDDLVIEINPRLTTSYIGLRAATQTNLAEAMLRRRAGEPVSIDYHGLPIAFDAGGIRDLASESY